MSKPGTKKHAKYIAVIHVYIVADAAMLFIFNGAVYFKTEQKVNVNKQGKWHNVILGTSLLGVMCCHNFNTPFRIIHSVVYFLSVTRWS